jgi:hypothetical protein
MRQTLDAWRVLHDAGVEMYFSERGCTEGDFAAYRAEYGGRLPRPLAALYSISASGFEVLEGSVRIEAWPPTPVGEAGVVEGSADAGLPPAFQVFGSDGGDDVWAFYLATSTIEQTSPALVIADHSLETMYIAADSVDKFLRLETASALLDRSPSPTRDSALSALGLPADLWALDLEDRADLDTLGEWADPLRDGHYAYDEPIGPGELPDRMKDLA